MDVQLRRDVAQLADVELGDRAAQRLADRPHRAPGRQDLVDQQRPLGGIQVLQLAGAGDPRQEDDPGEARIRLQPGLAQRELAQQLRGREEGGIGLEHDAASAQRDGEAKRAHETSVCGIAAWAGVG